ncbi:MAG: EAL domain-containing protein [Phycisphaerales bacterium]
MSNHDQFWSSVYRTAYEEAAGYEQQLQALLRIGCERFGMDGAVVTDVKGDTFTVLASWGPDSDLLCPGKVFDLKHSVCARVIGRDTAFRVDAATDDMAPYRDLPIPIEQYVGQAVRISGQAFGTVCFFNQHHNGRPVAAIPDAELGILIMTVAAVIERRLHLESEQEAHRIASIVEQSEDAIFTQTLERIITSWNRSAENLYGYTAQEIIGRSAQVLHGENEPAFVKPLLEKIRRGIRTSSVEAVHTRKDGSRVNVSVNLSPIRDPRGEVTALSVVVRDIDERKRAERALEKSEQRYALAAVAANDGLWDWDILTNEVYYSPRWKSILGYGEDELVPTIQSWTDMIHTSDLGQFQADLTLHLAGQSKTLSNQHRVLTRDGRERWVLCRGMAVRDEEGRAIRIAGSLSDITKQKESEAALIQQAHHDKLTNLPNRTLFVELIRQALARARRVSGYKFALLFLDFDRFKVINDSLGHEYGDMLLTSIAQQLRVQLRTVDTAARLGGDEFVVLLDGIDGLSGAIEVAERLLETFARPHSLGGHDVISTASIGIVTSEGDYHKPEEMVRDADNAMYQAKASGRARYVVFDEQMHAKALARLNLEKDIRKATALGQMRLDYQPIVSLESGELMGFEALVRWEHPELGPVRPDTFIQIAEETGEIVALGTWVLEQACRQLVVWKQTLQGAADIFVNVNVSKRQIAQPDVIATLARVFRETGVDPAYIKLEITESVIMDDRHGITPVLDEIRHMGVQLAMDDFGTGHSSLSCLHSFPIDVLKIDREFILNMEQRIEYTAVIQAIVTLAHTLGISVVAEGLETAEQVAQLQALECDHAQGYYFARPLSVAQAGEYITQQTQLKRSA